MISWEVFFGNRAADGIDHGGTFILNPTNGSSYTGTILQSQQVASSRLRAIENGRWVVQVSPTGFSAFVSPDGDVLDRTAVSEQKVIIRTISLNSGRTWYSRLGDTPFVLLLMLAYLRLVDRARPGVAGATAGYTSSNTVTGPSLTSDTCISVRKRPVATVAPDVSQLIDHGLHQRLGVLGSCGVDPTRSAAAAGVAVQRELADDQHLAGRVGDRAVHHSVVVVDHPQTPDLVGQLARRCVRVVVRHSDQHAQPRPDLPDDFSASGPQPSPMPRKTLCTKPRIDPSLPYRMGR